MDLDRLFGRHGVVRSSVLMRAGLSRHQISQLIDDGQLRSVAWGWLSNGTADAAVETAVRSGASLTCVSALRRVGVWCPPDRSIHLRYGEHERRTTVRGYRSCSPAGRPRPRAEAVDNLRIALESAAGCLAPDDLTAVIDSVLNQQLAEIEEVTRWFSRYPAGVREAVARCDPRAESGTETLVRLRLRRRHIKLRLQVEFESIGRVDMLVGDRLVIEVDSRAHHTDDAAYTNDRRRDRQLAGRGYLVVRLTYQQVMDDWAAAEQDLLAIIRRQDHRWSANFLRRSGGKSSRGDSAPRSAEIRRQSGAITSAGDLARGPVNGTIQPPRPG